MKTYYSTQDIERNHSGHWFSPSTKRFFRSRIGSQVFQGLGGIYFVSSEQFMLASGNPAPRRFTVRRYDPNTDQIETAGPFNELTRSQAYSRAKRYAVEGGHGHERLTNQRESPPDGFSSAVAYGRLYLCPLCKGEGKTEQPVYAFDRHNDE